MAAAPAIWGDLAVWQPLHLNRLIFSWRDSTQNGPPWYSTWASTLFRVGGVTEEAETPAEGKVVESLLAEVQLILDAPSDAARLMGLISRVETTLDSTVHRLVGSWKGNTAGRSPTPRHHTRKPTEPPPTGQGSHSFFD